MEEIIYSNLGTKFGTNPCCQESIAFSMCDCAALGVDCNGNSTLIPLSAFGFSDDWVWGGTMLPNWYIANRIAHSDDPNGCVSSPPQLIPMAGDCPPGTLNKQAGDAREILSYDTFPTPYWASPTCPDGKCRPPNGQCT